MNKRFWIALVACYVVGQVLGYVINQVLLADTYASLASVWRPMDELQSRLWVFMVTSFIAIFLFCYVFTKGYENKGLAEGLRYGALMGVLLAVPPAYDQFVVYPIPYSLALTWALAGIASWIILGAILALIYKREPAAAK